LIHGCCVDHRALLGLDPALDAQRSWTRIYGPDLARYALSTEPEEHSAPCAGPTLISASRSARADRRLIAGWLHRVEQSRA
jgi:hypothetical protein